jgi:hypothetical protein
VEIDTLSAMDYWKVCEPKMFEISIINCLALLSFPVREQEVECERNFVFKRENY